MGWIFEENNLLKITGLSAIFGMSILLFVDVNLLYMPIEINSYSVFKKAMLMERGDILMYSRIGLFAVPFVLFGLFHFFIAILRTHRLLAWAVLFTFFYAYLNNGLFNVILGYVMNVAHEIVPLKIMVPGLSEYFYTLFQIQFMVGIGIGSVFFFIHQRFYTTNYPKWYIWFTPLNLIFFIRFIIPLASPPSIAGFLFIAAFNLCMLITTVVSTVLLWNKTPDELFPAKEEASPEAA